MGVVEIACCGTWRRLSQQDARFRVNDLLWYCKRKRGAFTVDTLHGNIAVHQVDQLLADGKSQTSSLNIAVPFAVNLLEGSEKLADILGFDADSGV